MGATTFSTIAVGKSAEEAFRVAVEHAQWEHGHGGYTGTIAEKRNFALITLPPRVSAEKFLSWMDDFHAQFDNVDQATEYARNTLLWVQANVKRGTEGRAKRIKDLKQQIRKGERDYNAFWRGVPEPYRKMVRGATLTYNEKWGPALGIELKSMDIRRYPAYMTERKRGQRVFLFAGWASC